MKMIYRMNQFMDNLKKLIIWVLKSMEKWQELQDFILIKIKMTGLFKEQQFIKNTEIKVVKKIYFGGIGEILMKHLM